LKQKYIVKCVSLKIKNKPILMRRVDQIQAIQREVQLKHNLEKFLIYIETHKTEEVLI
jgi:hypothetical protein